MCCKEYSCKEYSCKVYTGSYKKYNAKEDPHLTLHLTPDQAEYSNNSTDPVTKYLVQVLIEEQMWSVDHNWLEEVEEKASGGTDQSYRDDRMPTEDRRRISWVKKVELM